MSARTALLERLQQLDEIDKDDDKVKDLVLLDHPGKQIQLHHIARAGSDAEKCFLVAARFPWLMDIIEPFRLSKKSRAQIQEIIGAADGEHSWQVEADVALLEPVAGELFAPDGSLRNGAQTRIAGILGLPQTGGSYRKRIFDAAGVLWQRRAV